MNLNLKNKVIIVTGGSKGIGFGICMGLIKEGAIPHIVGRKINDIKSAIKVLNAEGGKSTYSIAELTDEVACKKSISEVIKIHGRIDGLVNNAGVNDSIGLENNSPTEFIDSLKKNLVHYFTMTKYSLKYLKKSSGSIVNIGSKVSFTGQGNTSGYAAAKGGINSLTREWSLELLKYSIRVNTIIVAECYTPLYKKWIKTFPNPEQKLDEINKKIPLENRMTTIEEIANSTVFLLSEKSSHTTGQIMFVDGGYTHLDRSL